MLPEVLRIDLCAAVLQLLALGEADAARFPWLDAPSHESLAHAYDLLERLQLTRQRSLTELGRQAAGLPVHPRLGRLLLESRQRGCAERGSLAAALLSERDPFIRVSDSRDVPAAPPTTSDVLDRVEALEAFESNGRLDSPIGRLHPGSALAVLDVAQSTHPASRTACASKSR